MGEELENMSSSDTTTTTTTEPSSLIPRLKFPFLLLNSALNNNNIMDSSSSSSSPEHPLQTLASVPFKWEEQPGKPRPCTDIIVRPEPVSLRLELPPCRKHIEQYSSPSSSLTATDYSPCGGGVVTNDDSKITKTPSPTAVFDGPYNVGRPKFSSFRLFVRESSSSTTSQDHAESGGSSASPESINYLEGFIGTSKRMKRNRVRGLFGKFNRGGGNGRKKEGLDVGGGSFGFSSSSRFSPFSTTSSCCESEESILAARSVDVATFGHGGKIKRNGSFSSHGNNNHRSSSSHILASIYEGLKQVIHWNSSRKSSKENQV